MSNLSAYLRDTLSEMRQVSWPSQKQAALYTVLVIVISGLVSLFLGAFDAVFAKGVEFIIERL